MRWLAARNSLLALQRPHVDISEYTAIATRAGLDPAEAITLLDLLNDTGYVVHFSDDEGLRDLIVIQPEWLTKAIGLVLEDRETRARGGLLAHVRLPAIWEHGGRALYARMFHPYFVRLMEKFDVSYRVPDEDKSLVGQLVPYEQPVDAQEAVSEYFRLIRPPREHRELSLRCMLSEEAPGLMSWLIVRNHRFETSIHWRRGVLLRHTYGSEGLYQLHSPTELSLTVRGSSPVYFFNVLRDTLEDLCIRRWPGLSYQLRIPCYRAKQTGSRTCAEGFPVEAIEGFQQRGWTHITCNGCYDQLDVSRLATGFSLADGHIIERLDELAGALALVGEGVRRSEEAADVVRVVLRALSAEVTDN